MDDFFRSADNGLTSHPINRRYLRKLFESAVVRLGLGCHEEFALSDGGGIDVASVMETLSLPCSPEGWAQSVIADLSSADTRRLLPGLDASTLVIGWGLTPSLMNFIDRSGAVFIDFEIDPIRFTEHLKFCVRTNDRRTKHVLEKLRVSEEHCWNEAAALKGYFARHGERVLFDPRISVGLFIGQTSLDLALVARGRLARPIDVASRVRELSREVDLLVIKPHPYEGSTSHLADLAAAVPNVAWTNQNVYALLCAENLSFVCGLSSGTLQEAAYFLKPAQRLISADRTDPKALPGTCCEWIPVPATVASIETLAAICNPHPNLQRALRFVVPQRSKSERTSGSFREDTLDHAFGVRWGLDRAQPGLPLMPRLQLGYSYEFCSGNPGTAWLAHGWSTPEPWGVWSVGERSCIVIPLGDLDPAQTEGMEVHLTGQLLCPANTAPPTVLVSLDGGPETALVLANEGTAQISASIPIPEVKGYLMIIEFFIQNPLRPSDVGLGPDERLLGLGLQKLRISRSPVKQVVAGPERCEALA